MATVAALFLAGLQTESARLAAITKTRCASPPRASRSPKCPRGELILGYTIAGFATAIVPQAWFSAALEAVQRVPVFGYPLVLLAGLLLAVLTFVCSMGNVPVARFLAMAGIPLGANTTFIYGDLLVPPLVGIYRKSFPPKVTWTFVAFFVAGAMLAGWAMDALLGHVSGMSMSNQGMLFNDRFTMVSNIAGIVAIAAVWMVAKRRTAP